MNHRPTGWNTWDFRGFNHLVYVENGRVRLKLRCAIWDPTLAPTGAARRPGGLYDSFRWEHVRRVGPHAPLGLPAELEFLAGATPYLFRAEERDGTLEASVWPLAETSQRVVFVLEAPVDTPLKVRSARTARFAAFDLELLGATWPTRFFLNISDPFAVADPGTAATIRVRGGRASGNPGTLERYQSLRLRGEGALTGAPEAMMQAIAWNTLYDPWRCLVLSPASRDWCFDWAGPIVFGWDTFFVGAAAALESPELARMNFEAVCAGISRFGFVPNYVVSHGAVSLDRSMPPLGAYLIWKNQLPQPQRAWLKRVYRLLKRWHRFWPKYRDGNGNGLLEWGSNASPEYDYPQLCTDIVQTRHCAQAAKWESGLDNSPMYDDVPFNEQTHTLELDDIGLSCYWAADAEALAALAEYLGRSGEPAAFRRQHQKLERAINGQLWDQVSGIYCNRHWDGRFSARWSPTSFFPLLAGVAPPERAERLVSEHLLDERQFWGRYVIPSISRSDPAYTDNDYWRGRIWGPLNFLVAEGLRRYRFDDIAAELAEKSLLLFLENCREGGAVYENYNAETGAGGDVRNSARLYHWGALLAWVAIQELIDVEVWGYLRLGSVRFPDAAIRNVHIGTDLFDVELDRGVRVVRSGELFAESSVRAIVRIPLPPGTDRPIEISAAGSGRLILHDMRYATAAAVINGRLMVGAAGDPPRYEW